MSDHARTTAKRATVGDYMSLDDGKRYELIDGKLVLSRTPLVVHQLVLGNLLRPFLAYHDRRNRSGVLRMGPTDLFLKGEREDPEHVLVPDLLYVSSKKRVRMKPTGLHGAPDVVVEVLSSNERRDRATKRRIYAFAGLPELWLVHPEKRHVEVYRHAERGLELVGTFKGKAKVACESVPGLVVSCSEVFADLPRWKKR